jgi:hypothetical protein
MSFASTLKAGTEKAPEILKMKLISLQCDTKLNQKFSQSKLDYFYYYLPKEIFCSCISGLEGLK